MQVQDAMTREVVSCSIGDTLCVAAQRMWDHDCGAMPVVDADGRLAGMITDRDICMAAYTQGRPLHEIPVTGAMARQVFSCYADDRIEEAEAVMAEKQVRRLPVVDDFNVPIGMLSLSDIAREALASGQPRNGRLGQETVRAFAAITAPRMSRRRAFSAA